MDEEGYRGLGGINMAHVSPKMEVCGTLRKCEEKFLRYCTIPRSVVPIQSNYSEGTAFESMILETFGIVMDITTNLSTRNIPVSFLLLEFYP